MPISGGAVVTGIYDAYVCVRDKKAQGTNGGSFDVGAWRTRDMNDEQADTAEICSVASNQITLEAGSYRVVVVAPAIEVGQHQTRLQNITASATLLVGTSEYSGPGGGVQTHSFIIGRFTLAAQSVLEVQHRGLGTKTINGFGVACNLTDEIYTVAEFWREASQ